MMRAVLCVAAACVGFVAASGAGRPDGAAFTVDCAEAPELKEWGDKAKSLCEEWYPKIIAALPSDGFTPRASVKLVFKKEMKVPAATGGGVISINAEYVGKHKDDFGMVVHELTHVVQAYPRNKAVNGEGKPADMGWLVEGIADYIRFYQYEPQVHIRVDPAKASYRNGYRVTAAFLAYLARTHDPEIVRKLNAALRAGDCGEAMFKSLTGKELPELWKEFIATLPERPAAK